PKVDPEKAGKLLAHALQKQDMKNPKPDDSRVLEIEWVERDLDKGGPDRVIDRITTREDVKRNNKMLKMLERDEKDPNYDDTELKKALLDDLMRNPNFANFRNTLEAMKEDLSSEQEQARIDTETAKEMQPQLENISAAITMELHQEFQKLIDDPEFAEVKDDVIALQSRVSNLDDLENDDVQSQMTLLNEKLEKIPAFAKKMALLESNQETENEKSEKGLWTSLPDEKLITGDLEVDSLLREMKGVLEGMGGDGDSKLRSELDQLLNAKPVHEEEGRFQDGFDVKDLTNHLRKLQNMPMPEEAQEEKLDPDLEAKVNKIMDDPQLLRKLALIKEMMDERQAEIGPIAHSSAPDPMTLDRSQLTTYKERLRIAENDPEHVRAMKRLQIHLRPPFSVSPALKSLNEALKLSYLGASDDVRRILWRSYSKARTIPTLLQNIPDDAWDILWYSQAVTWTANQNRQDHLRILLHDLSAIGRDGPPTSPETL
ncbi:hypothetical protein BU24DRAFT_316537, partial [Aaosphaeria arxii CBS 175.79]